MVVLPRYEQTTEPPTQKPIKWAFEATKTLFAVISQLEHNRKKGANIMSIIENNKQQTIHNVMHISLRSIILWNMASTISPSKRH